VYISYDELSQFKPTELNSPESPLKLKQRDYIFYGLMN